MSERWWYAKYAAVRKLGGCVLCGTLLVRSREGCTMRGAPELSKPLRAFGFMGALEHVEAREQRGAVQQCSEACADAAAMRFWLSGCKFGGAGG